jgi:2-keto-3-deoxy-L-rhamnonate aldolase RhmA
MIKPNKVKASIHAGRKVYGFLLPFPCASIVEIMGHLGFDFVMVDAEHGPFTPESAEEMFRAADSVGLTPLVRVPDHEFSTILRFLDRGAGGIQAPHTNTRAQAEQVVQAVKYSPLGKRGLGSNRACSFGAAMSRSEYAERANRETMITVQLEELEALKNLDDILKVEHIDAFAFGANDLSQSMGFPGQASHPKVQEAIQQASARIKAAGKIVAPEMMVSVMVDGLLVGAAREFLAKARGG